MDIQARHYDKPRSPESISGVKEVEIKIAGHSFVLYDDGRGSLEVRSRSMMTALIVVPSSIGALYLETRKIK